MSIHPTSLGSPEFRAAYGVKSNYVMGGMVKGISSVTLVQKATQAGYLAFYGAGGMRLEQIDAAIRELIAALGPGKGWGVNFLHNALIPHQEDALIELLLARGIQVIEASAFVRITPALVRFRLSGLRLDPRGQVIPRQRIMAKVSHPEIARRFMLPAPVEMVDTLRQQGYLTEVEASLSQRIPLADDICAEADSGGHTDRRPAYALVPTFLRLRDRLAEHSTYPVAVRIGTGGGIGSPEAVAAAFALGADFVMTGSINQCTPEAGTSDAVKDLLAKADVQDFDMAPAGDLFEIGAKIQVLKRGTLFAPRANRLYDLYRHHQSLEEIPLNIRQELEQQVLGRSFDAVWQETRDYYQRTAPWALEQLSAKQQMAMIFRWYFIHSQRLAQQGLVEQSVNFQIHSGPAMASCNQWLSGSDLERWPLRHVDILADRLMAEAAQILSRRLNAWSSSTA